MSFEEAYRKLLERSAQETQRAQNTRFNQIERPKPTVFSGLRQNNEHNERIVIETLAKKAGVKVKDIIKYNNHLHISNLRHIVIYALRQRLHMTFSQIASLMNRDSATVQSSVKKAEVLIENNPFLIDVIDDAVAKAKR